MTAQEYATLRKKVGRQWDMAVLLGCNVKTIKRREQGLAPISEEDAKAILEAVENHKPEFEAPMMVKGVDATPAKRSGDVLQDNIRHWYVSPGYVLNG